MASSDDPERKVPEPGDDTSRQGPTPEAPAEAGDDLEASLRPLKSGQIVSGLVVHLDEHGALVDVGAKSEGLVPTKELGRAAGETADVAVGDRIDVYVVKPDADDGHILLSKKRADYERIWNQVTEAFEKGETVSAMVVDRVKGGLVVDMGLRGFLPASHVATRNVNALDRFVGQSLRLKVIEVDRARKRVVVSHRLAAEEERGQKRKTTLESLEEGQVRKGVVRRITDYGAFVDIGGLDGLLHVTEMSWTRVRHPSDVVKPGQKIEVMVLKFDPASEKVSLGLKQILPDPWQHVEEKYAVGQTVSGRVTRLVPFGAFVQFEDGIEGVIRTSELSERRAAKPDEVLSPDQPVQAKVIAIRPSERRMDLSLRQVQQDKERQEYSEYQSRQREEGRETLGDRFGEMLAQRFQAAPPEQAAGEDSACESSDSPGESPAEKAESPTSSD